MPADDRMTLTDIATHIGTTRPSMYVIARSVGFPHRGPDRRWARADIMAWLAENTQPADAVRVGGVLVVRSV